MLNTWAIDPTSKIRISVLTMGNECQGVIRVLQNRAKDWDTGGQSLGHPSGESGLICHKYHKLGPENDEYSAHPNVIRMSRTLRDFTIVMHRRDEMIWEISTQQDLFHSAETVNASICIDQSFDLHSGVISSMSKRDVESSVVFSHQQSVLYYS